MSSPPQNMVSKVLDYLAVLMCGLTGPFAIMLSPTAFLAWRKGRDRWKLILTSTLLASAGVQGTLIFFADRSARMKEPLGANLASLIEMLADHVFLGALVVRNIFVHTHPLGALVVATLGIATVLYGLIRGPLPLKFFILFAGLVLACSLASPITWPMVNGVAPRPRVSEWQALVVGGGTTLLVPAHAGLCRDAGLVTEAYHPSGAPLAGHILLCGTALRRGSRLAPSSAGRSPFRRILARVQPSPCRNGFGDSRKSTRAVHAPGKTLGPSLCRPATFP